MNLYASFLHVRLGFAGVEIHRGGCPHVLASSSFGMNLNNPRGNLSPPCGCGCCARASRCVSHLGMACAPRRTDWGGALPRFFAIFTRFIFLFCRSGRSLGFTNLHRKLFVRVTGSPSVGDLATPWLSLNTNLVMLRRKSDNTFRIETWSDLQVEIR